VGLAQRTSEGTILLLARNTCESKGDRTWNPIRISLFFIHDVVITITPWPSNLTRPCSKPMGGLSLAFSFPT
jgi:hypothetical protein